MNIGNPNFYIEIVAVWTVLIVVYVLARHKTFSDTTKKVIFILLVVPIVLSSLYLGAHTIYLNVASVTKGPVHWHADYEVWACGERLDLIDPKFPRNKIGSPLLHEHNDDRIHIEGVVSDLSSISFGNYFNVIGGELRDDGFKYVTTSGLKQYTNGDECPAGAGTLKVYVNGNKIENAHDYLIYPSSYVPPGDCIIVMFDESTASTTDHICTSWSVKGWNYTTPQDEVTIGGNRWP